jgi:hypothetical protein
MIPGNEIELGGEVYTLPPLSLGDVERHQARVKAGEDSPATLIVDAVHAALKRNYPDLDRAVVADNLDIATMGHFMNLVMDSTGELRKDYEGKALAARKSTGPASTAT